MPCGKRVAKKPTHYVRIAAVLVASRRCYAFALYLYSRETL